MALSQISLFSAPTFLIYALPLLIAITGAGLVWAVIGCALIFALRVILGFVAFQAAPKGYTLETIGASPYAEVVRWSLDRLGEPYREVESIGIVGVLLYARLVPALHIQRLKTSIYNSPDILRFLYGTYCGEERAEFLKPVTKEADVALERIVLSTSSVTRKWVYFHAFNSFEDNEVLFKCELLTCCLECPTPCSYPGSVVAFSFTNVWLLSSFFFFFGSLYQFSPPVACFAKAWGMYQSTTPTWQKVLMRLGRPIAEAFVLKKLDVDEASKNSALVRIKADCEAIEKRLADGRKYLLGDEFSYLDIIWASSMGLMLFPDGYSGGQLEPQSKCSRDDFPEALMSEMRPILEREAGRFCLRIYEEQRGLAIKFQN